jgi:hypothetical protein
MSTNRHRKKGNKALLAAGILILLVGVFGCKDAGDIYSPEEWRDLLNEAGGWKPLPFPDSKYGPGAIIKVSDDGIRWIDHLRSCGYPEEVLEPEKSYIPSVEFTKTRELGASALINFKGIAAGPSFGKISKVAMAVTDHGADALRLIKLKVWMEVPANRESVAQACMDELMKPDRYLVTEAFRVSKGKYTLYDQTGAALKLETPILRQLLQFAPDVKYEVTGDGSLMIEEPAYFAVRMAVRVGEDWDILGTASGEPESADAKIEALFLKQENQP